MKNHIFNGSCQWEEQWLTSAPLNCSLNGCHFYVWNLVHILNKLLEIWAELNEIFCVNSWHVWDQKLSKVLVLVNRVVWWQFWAFHYVKWRYNVQSESNFVCLIKVLTWTYLWVNVLLYLWQVQYWWVFFLFYAYFNHILLHILLIFIVFFKCCVVFKKVLLDRVFMVEYNYFCMQFCFFPSALNVTDTNQALGAIRQRATGAARSKGNKEKEKHSGIRQRETVATHSQLYNGELTAHTAWTTQTPQPEAQQPVPIWRKYSSLGR